MKYIAVVALFGLSSCDVMVESRLDEKEFSQILAGIEKSWNAGDARRAAEFFSDDAVYEEPPKKQFYRGKNEIYEFFGGEKGVEKPMKMKWHNLSFNEEEQIGFGEYTFAMNNQYHGIVIIKFDNKKISKWREYQYKSELDFQNFTGESGFESFDPE
jgi:ketosteroid isomerase-like protein